MRYTLFILLTSLGLHLHAQGHIGLAAGASFCFVSGYNENNGLAEHEMRSPSPSIALFARGADKGPVNFGLHLGYMHKSLVGNWSQGGLGANSSRNGDFSMHLFRITAGPEIAVDSIGRTRLRVGLDVRMSFAGRFKGKAHEYEPFGENFSVQDTVMNVSGMEALLFLGFRVIAAENARWITTVEPYAAFAPVSALVGGGPNTRWLEFGLAVGLARKTGKPKLHGTPAS